MEITVEKNVRLVLEIEGTYRYTSEMGNREKEKFRVSITPPKKKDRLKFFPNRGKVLVSSFNSFRKFEYDGYKAFPLWTARHHECGASGWDGGYCPVCDPYEEAEYIISKLVPQLKERGYIRER